MSTDRSPPHSAEAEEHVIACCLLDGVDTINRTIDEGLEPESFYFPANRLIYEILLQLRAQQKPVNLDVLFEELKTRRQMEAIGGPAYLMQVTGKIPTTAHAGYFIETVKTKAQLRNLIKTATGAVEQAYSANGTATELMEQVRADIESVTRPPAGSLQGRAFSAAARLTKPKPVFSAAGTTICTPGNLTTLYSPPKAGKSSLLGAMLAATMLPPGDVAHDCLGIKGPNPEGKAVIHFDTEQSPYDWQQMILTSLRRAGNDALPKWLLSYSLTGLGAPDCRRALESVLRSAKKKFGGIHSVHLDGIGDFVTDPNDSGECFPFITSLHGLAIEYQTAIINVLHLNPGSEEKGRGHLGSHLERKSESNLMLEKKDGVSFYWGAKQRGKSISKSEAPAFEWSEEHQMHVSTKAPDHPKKAGGRKAQHTIDAFWDCIPKKGEPPQSGTQIHRRAVQLHEIKINTFKDLLAAAYKEGLLARTYDDKTGYAYGQNV